MKTQRRRQKKRLNTKKRERVKRGRLGGKAKTWKTKSKKVGTRQKKQVSHKVLDKK